MATIFKIRRDTAANWSSENPTLAAGEMGLDQTNNFIKMGDGSTAWNSLAQFTQNIENVEDLVGAMVTSNTETFITVTYDDSDGTLDFVVPVLDEDAMGSNSAAHLATQQSIKSYVDAQTHLSLIDEDNMATDSATRPPSQQSVKAYVDAQTHLSLIDEDDMSTDSATRPPSQQSVKAYVDAQVTAQDLDFQGDSGGALSIDLDSETLTIAGGTGIDTVGSGNGVTASIDATVATLAGSQTLTNKTIGAATIAGHLIPDTNIAYDLGSSTHRFNDLWLDGASIRLGDATITSSGSAVVLPSGSTVSGAGTMMDFTTHVIDEDNMASDSATQYQHKL